MRRAANTDKNQTRIANLARKLGASVAFLHFVGEGIPDLLLGYYATNILVEVKNPEQGKRAKLNKRQEDFFNSWKGFVAVVWTDDDLIALLELVRRQQLRRRS